MADKIQEHDKSHLHKMGYAQQLARRMSGFSNFAISFSIISVLTGAILLFGYGLKFAGPIINSLGWPIVSLFTLCVAASMAELSSAYPTAGGLYFWAYRLGGRTWAWITAWLNMIGQATIAAGVNIAAATYLIGAVTTMLDIPTEPGVPRHIAEFDVAALERRRIAVDRHCFGCAAGAGSSCAGATASRSASSATARWPRASGTSA